MRQGFHGRMIRAVWVTIGAAAWGCASTPPPIPESGVQLPVPAISSEENPFETADAGDPAQPAGPDSGASDSTPTQAQTGGKSGLRRHAESGVESMIIGTVVGGQIFGQYGAAAGAALFGLYGFLTGDVPFETSAGGPDGRGPRKTPGSILEDEIEEELDRQATLENGIEEELRRQEELLASISRQEEINDSGRYEQDARAAYEQPVDPLAAPGLPYERRIPDSLFDRSERKRGNQEQVVKSLDADRDGRPEIELLFDPKSGELVSRHEDTDYDGVLDVQNRYEAGKLKERIEDTNHDGRPDRWVDYDGDRATKVRVDRDFDGRVDAFYIYEDGVLRYEEHDTNQDGRIDRRVEYEGKLRVLELEDRNHNGKMEFRTFYDAAEIPVRTEQDLNEDGRTEVWEYYEGTDPSRVVLVRRQEDVDADGKVDVTSYYEQGKLVRKEVSDPGLLLQ